MKVRIKEYIYDTSIRYMVQYLWLGFIWRNYDHYYNKKDALKGAKDLAGRKLPRCMTIEEAEKEVEQEKKEQG